MKEKDVSEIWSLYQKGIDYIHKINLVDETDEAHRFYSGEQWYGLQSGDEKMPSFNFIKGIVKYKIAVVAQNTMSAIYSNSGPKDELIIEACEALNTNFRKQWDLAKMDTLSWKIVKDAAIQGDSYLFFPGSDVTEIQIIDNVNVLLGDEKNNNIQEQPYIILIERRFTEDIKKDAKKYGIKDLDLDLIQPDEDYQNQIGDKNDIISKNGKCTSLLYMYKDENGIVHYLRSVQNLIYQKDTIIQGTDSQGNLTQKGLTRYPLINFIWEERKGTARGIGEVKQWIPNQIEVNKTLARRSIAVQQNAFGKLAYNENAINNPDDLDIVGAKIAIKDGSAQNINNMIAYLNPSTMSPDAKNLSDELVTMSKELAGAGEAATGSIDPTQASGTAIIAVRDQLALPLNEQVSTYRQFTEDFAMLLFDIWLTYNPNGLEVTIEDEEQIEQIALIPYELLESMKVNLRIDVSQNNPYSRFAQEKALENLFIMQAITFAEYVESLDDDAVVPKQKLKDIIDKRKVKEQETTEQTINQLQGQLNQSTQIGGNQNAMQSM